MDCPSLGVACLLALCNEVFRRICLLFFWIGSLVTAVQRRKPVASDIRLGWQRVFLDGRETMAGSTHVS